LQYRLAHLSDPHLGPLPFGAALQNFAFKRLIGGMSWMVKRRRLHQMQIADGIRADVITAQAHHVAVTGDLVNIAALAEFEPAARWLAGFGSPQNVSYVPGNHDCYVPIPYNSGLAHFEPFTEGDMKLQQPLLQKGGTMAYPYVRLRRNIALIGLSSGLPQALHRASGELGPAQLAQLAKLLPELQGKGYCRVVLIHHPPMKILANDRRGLRASTARNLFYTDTITKEAWNISSQNVGLCQCGVRLLLPCGHTNTMKQRDGRCSILSAIRATGQSRPGSATGISYQITAWRDGPWSYPEHEFHRSCHAAKVRLPGNGGCRI
jgi:3',5'-cyclic AMP phosphodiesterase CpdA